MKYRIDSRINDGKAEAPPVTVEVDDFDDLLNRVGELACNDFGEPYGVGATIEITRVAA